MASIPLKVLKVVAVIDGGDLPRDIIPPLGTPGSAKASVTFSLAVPAGEGGAPLELQVTTKVQAYRKALDAIDKAEHGAVIAIKGAIRQAGILSDAGFDVQAKESPKIE